MSQSARSVSESSASFKCSELCIKDAVILQANKCSQEVSSDAQNLSTFCLPQSSYIVDEGVLQANFFQASRSIENDVSPSPTNLETVPTISLNQHKIPLQASEEPHGQGLPEYEHGVCPQPYIGHWGTTFARTQCNVTVAKSGNRGRTTYSDEQVAELESVFARNPYPTPQARQQLSRDIHVPEGKIKIWFQNRRARAKKQRNGSAGWRPFRGSSADTSQDDQNSNNNNASAGAKPMDFAANFQPLATIPESQTRAWCFDAKDEMGNRPERPQSSLSLSSLSLQSSDTMFASCEADAKSAQSRPSNCSASEPNYTHNHHEARKALDDNSELSAFGCASQGNIACYGLSGQPTTSHGHSTTRCQDYEFPERFPVISSAFEYGFAQGSVPFGAQYFCYGVPDQRKGGGMLSCEAQSGFGSCASETRYFSSKSPVFHRNQTTSLEPKSNRTADEEQTPLTGSCLNGGALNTSHSYNAITLLQSPPPIRRFVFPFENLLENARITNNALSLKKSFAENASSQQCSLRNFSEINPNASATADASNSSCDKANYIASSRDITLDISEALGGYHQQQSHVQSKSYRSSPPSCASNDAKRFWQGDWQRQILQERGAPESQVGNSYFLQNQTNGVAGMTVADGTDRGKYPAYNEKTHQNMWPQTERPGETVATKFCIIGGASLPVTRTSPNNACKLSKQQSNCSSWSNDDLSKTPKAPPSEPMVG